MSRAHIAAGSALYAAGALVVLISPTYIGAVAERFALSPTQIGLLASVEATGGVVASLTSAYWLSRVNQRSAAIAALAVMTAGAAATPMAPTFELLVAIRLATSVIGGGVAYAVGIAWLAQSATPDRAFAIGGGVQALAPALMLVVAPALLAAGGLKALMGAAAAIFVVAMSITALSRGDAVAVDVGTPAITTRPSIGVAAIALLGSAFALTAGTQSYWAFAEVLGSWAGINAATIGNGLAIAAVAGLPAAALAVWCANRISPRRSFRLGAAGIALALAPLTLGVSPSGYVAAAIAVFFFSVFLTPFQLGALARADGGIQRSAALAPAAQSIGIMVGPFIAGHAAALASTYLAAIWVALAFLAATWIGYEVGARKASP